MNFWKMAYDIGVVSEEKLRRVVKTDINKYGYITKEEFKGICGKEFDVVESPADPQATESNTTV